MARFNVCRNPEGDGYLLDLQADPTPLRASTPLTFFHPVALTLSKRDALHAKMSGVDARM